MKRRLALNTLLNALGTGWAFLISLALTPLLIRVLGKDAYGAWILVTSFSVVSGYLSLLDFGFQTSLVKFVAEHHARQETDILNPLISAALYFFGGLGLVASILLLLFGSFLLTRVFSIPPELVGITRWLLYLLAVQILFEFPGLVFQGILEGLQRYDLLRIIEMTRLGCYAVILIVLLFRGYGLLALGITTLVIAALRTIVMAALTRRLLPAWRLMSNLRMGTLRRVASFSSQVFVLRINAVIYNQMDKAIIGALLISTLLTDYDIANKVQALVLATLTLTSSLIVPAASQLDALNDRTRLQQLFLQGTKYTLAICLPVAVSAFVLADSLISVWIGTDYVHDAGITRLFVSYLFITPAVVVGYNMMIGMGRIRPLLWTQVSTTVLNIVLSVILTPSMGVAGVIWGTLAGTATAAIPYLWHALGTLDISWSRFFREVLWPTYPVAAILGLVLYALDRLILPNGLYMLVGIGLIGMITYGLVFVSFGLNTGERQMLLRLATARE